MDCSGGNLNAYLAYATTFGGRSMDNSVCNLPSKVSNPRSTKDLASVEGKGPMNRFQLHNSDGASSNCAMKCLFVSDTRDKFRKMTMFFSHFDA